MVSALLWLAMVADLRKRFGTVPFAFAWPTHVELKTLATQSALYFVPSAATPIVLALPVLLLGRMTAESNAVLAYTVFRTFTGLVRQFVAQLCLPVGSEMARQQALGDYGKLRKLFTAGGRLTAGLAGVMGGVTFILAEPFLRIWTHGAVAYDPWLLSAFLVTVILLAPAQVAMVLYFYNNRPLILVVGHGGYAIGTVVFCGLLIKDFSAVGAAAGTGLAEFVFIGLLVSATAAREIAIRPGPY